jgi:malate dehydrogenase (oxaloacetate-decarboxylating)(NADP+)
MGGIISAVKNRGLPPREHRALFFGAGSAAVGIAKQIVQYFVQDGGLDDSEACSLFWLVDRKGLVINDRGDKLPDHKEYFSRR